jgi:signal transduction histidine kinase/CheY-like chemotaxis protein
MKLDLDQIKLNTFGSRVQITFFKRDGTLVKSCQSILRIDPEVSVYDQFVFLQSLEEVFRVMDREESYDFPVVEWDEGAKGLFHLTFSVLESEEQDDLIQWTFIDNTLEYQQMVELQQGRNDNAISEEFAHIQKRVAQMEKQLIGFQHEELKRVQEFKTEFFAQVSHEMRTPLNSISGLVSLLMENESRGREYLPALQATSKHLNSIINDILDLSKIDAGKLRFESVDFDLSDKIRAIMKGFEYTAGDKEISLKLELPDEPVIVRSDPTRLAQILYNLLGNSLKFTEKGHVGLALSKSADADAPDSWQFSVTDTGIGMDPDQIESLLQPYSQAEDKTTRLYGGTGLGLHIALKLVEAMGGQLEIESALHEGTEMRFVLVLEKGELQAHQGLSANANLDLRDYSILVAEDDPVNQKILREMLAAVNVGDATVVADGSMLSDEIQRKNYDLVITDINLPGKTGLEVFLNTRESGKELPFLFISGNNLAEEENLKQYKNWAFVMKPVENNRFVEKLAALLPKKYNTELDLSNLKEMISGDMSFFKDLVQTILETLPLELDKLGSSLAAGDVAMATKVLHKIRPSIDYLGISDLSSERHWLHSQAEANKTDDAYLLRIREFDTWVRQVLVRLQNEI